MEKTTLAFNLVKDSPTAVTPVWLVAKPDLAAWLKSRPAQVQAWVKTQNFKGDSGQICTLPAPDGTLLGVLLGLGDGPSTPPDPWAFAKLAESLPPATYGIHTPLDAATANLAALGWGLTSYRFERYKAANNTAPATLVAPENCDLAAVERALGATFLVRDLVNTPTSDMGPEQLEDAARRIALRHKAAFSTIVGDDLLARNFAAIHTVGRAAAEAPRLVDISWGRIDAPKVTLVGKGVCFDSGGLDIKPSSGMRLMKKDMGGAAHVLALGQMIMEAGLDLRLRLLVPMVENAVSGNAFRPGDIIKTHKGLTVEVGNTDAEGRLVLCDALSLAAEEKPDLLIDFATLTGAARVALGPDVPPFFTDDTKLAADLARLSLREADPVWQLPLWMPYDDGLKSTIADLNNISDSAFGGAISAALFLKRFIGGSKSWVHFDVYAWNAGKRPGLATGGEAMALRTVYALIAERYGANTSKQA